MKILMTADTLGGVWTYALQLARGLQRADTEVILATMGRLPTPEQRFEASRSANLTLCSSEFALEWMNDPWADVDRAAHWLLELESKFQPDIIHINGYAHAALPWQAPKLVACHSCVLSWWAAVNSSQAPLKEWGTYRDRVKQGLRSADFIVAPSAAMLSSIRALYGEPPCPGAVIANAVDCSLYDPGKKEPYIASAGRLWDAGKNVKALIEAGAEIAWPVYLAGEASKNITCENNLSPNVVFLGQLPPARMAALLRCAAIYCLPARYEPFGLSVLEAAHARCPLVLGDIPSLRENWQGAAMFVSPDDVSGLAGVLEELIGDNGLRNEYAQRARHRAQQFLPATFAASYFHVYQHLNAARARGAKPGLENIRCAS
jgi:glycogen synthase